MPEDAVSFPRRSNRLGYTLGAVLKDGEGIVSSSHVCQRGCGLQPIDAAPSRSNPTALALGLDYNHLKQRMKSAKGRTRKY